MFKIVVDIADVNYDNLLDQMMEMMKEQEKNGNLNGAKIPPMPDSSLLKKMPQAMKNQMLVAALQMEKKKIVEMLEKALGKVVGELTIKSFELQAKNESDCVLRAAVTIQTMDYLSALDKMLPFLTEADCLELLGEASEFVTPEQLPAYLAGQTQKQQEFLTAKSFRIKKEVLIQKVEELATDRNAYLKIGTIRFLVES